MLPLLWSVAVATTTLEVDRAVTFEAGSPVAKVVKLLTDMKHTLEEETKNDQEQYEKFTCWCSNTDGQKAAAIDEATRAIEDFEADIERRTKKDEKLTGGIKAAEADIASATDSLDSANAQRTKDAAQNHEAMVALTRNIGSLKAAVTVLKKHQATEFPQLHLNFLQQVQPVDTLTAWMDSHQFRSLSSADEAHIETTVSHYISHAAPAGYSHEELVALVKAQGLVRSFAQADKTHVEGYHSQPGEIFGVLTQLKEELEADLAETQERDARQAGDHAAMTGALQEQRANAEQLLAAKNGEQAANSKALADAKEQLADTQKSLGADQVFLKELRETCKTMDADWLEKRSTRQQELLAVSEAMDMLLADDARGSFGGTFAFLQLSERSTQRQTAAGLLKRAGHKAHSTLLLELASSVELDAFTKVKQAIADMVAALKQQQADEVKHKAFCEAELQKNTMEQGAKANEIEDVQALIAQLESAIATLQQEIHAAQAELVDMKVSAQRANEDRVAENKDFQATVAEQRATRDILAKVKGRLNEFYERALIQQTPQEEAYKQTHVVPPKGGEYKQSAGSGSVITMLDNLITDAMKLETEAIKAENDAQAEYERFTADNNAAMGAKEKEIVTKQGLHAEGERDHEQANADLKASLGDLAALHKYNGDLHKACDFVQQNFDARQTARREELDALQQATAILSGSSE